MPKLDDNYAVDIQTQTKTQTTFEEYYHNLLTHEYGHLDFGELAANDIEALLLDKTSMASCEDWGTASTQHGRTQGAYFFDLL